MASRILVRRSAAVEEGEAGALYVSTTGNDTTGTGTISNPFLTLGKARDAVRALNDSMSADIHVYLRGGRYPLTSTVVFDAQDSGTNGFDVCYRAYPGEQPRLSGGTALTGFSDAGGGVWTKDVGSLRFRQLYVDGVRCWRARNPNLNSYGSLTFWDIPSKVIQITASHLGTPTNLSSVELVIHGHGVNSCYLRVASVSGSGSLRIITPQEPERQRIFDQGYPSKGPQNPYWFENAIEYLDQPGEFYINPSTNLLSYMKRTAENLSTAEVMAPAVECLLQVQGTPGTEAHHIRFEGLIFEHTTWLSPNSNGFIGDQAFTEFVETLPPLGEEIESYPSVPMPAAVHVEDAEFIDFFRCIFRHCGSSAINLYRNCDDCSIIGCVMHDLSSCAIAVDCNMEGNPVSAVTLCERPVIQNNYITNIGVDYHQAIGITTTYVIEPLIEHNEVSDTSYSGISIGWGWADQENDMSGAIVRHNEVWNTNKKSDDGGGIYAMSRQDGALITQNYIHDIALGIYFNSHPVVGIYLDNGSGEITVSDNVIVNAAPTGNGEIFQNDNGAGVTLSNNAGNTPTGNEGLEAAFEDIRALVE